MNANGLIIFTSGFGSGSSGQSSGSDPENTGLGELSQQNFINALQYEKALFSWDEQDEAMALIKNYHAEHPNAPIVLIGHSFGADSSIEIAEQLGEININVSKMVLIDSIGFDDDQIPSNVGSALNLHSTSGDGIDGEADIKGALNVGLDETSHTDIDNDPRAWFYIRELIGGSDGGQNQFAANDDNGDGDNDDGDILDTSLDTLSDGYSSLGDDSAAA
jgi:pimeloyl-ACP methyl ester carboxylesterase